MAELDTAVPVKQETVVTATAAIELRGGSGLHDLWVDSLPAGRLDRSRLRDFYSDAGKRCLDVAVAAVLLIALLPAILLLALLVAVLTGWPPFYSARRVGKDGREFSMLKLRTMVRDADRAFSLWPETNPDLARIYASEFKLRHDPRVTALGRFLRRASLDELPQLWNVLRGDMSIVGPRPYYSHELAEFPAASRDITSVRPGLTGPWQIGGRNALAPAMRVLMDQRYARGYSLTGDIACLLRTLRALARMDGL